MQKILCAYSITVDNIQDEEPQKSKMSIPNFKILIIGDTQVGKTSLVTRICKNTFDECFETIGVDCYKKVLNIFGDDVSLQIWDTAGQERFKAVCKPYYRNAVGVFVVFSIDNHKSFDDIGKWIEDAQGLCDQSVKIMLIGNKVDLVEQRKVTNQEAQEFADSLEIEYIETSAKNNTNVVEAFDKIARQVYQTYKMNKVETNEKTTDPNEGSPVVEEQTKTKRCC
ncbi:small GTP-binding protein [Histomonas meleagridis]|uniref:small GTP-binding protein n=1 Tax=Histomonas meleagridis TaxID=135588 RepID=UPI003559CE0A|nr:small GTP-binding protein [Histomonas meleagridis]KAH0799464.1 small GTP-binding protein [Histomonas meleagridis]